MKEFTICVVYSETNTIVPHATFCNSSGIAITILTKCQKNSWRILGEHRFAFISCIIINNWFSRFLVLFRFSINLNVFSTEKVYKKWYKYNVWVRILIRQGPILFREDINSKPGIIQWFLFCFLHAKFQGWGGGQGLLALRCSRRWNYMNASI